MSSNLLYLIICLCRSAINWLHDKYIGNACYALTASRNRAKIPSCFRISCITPHFLVFLLGVSAIVVVPCAFSPDSVRFYAWIIT